MWCILAVQQTQAKAVHQSGSLSSRMGPHGSSCEGFCRRVASVCCKRPSDAQEGSPSPRVTRGVLQPFTNEKSRRTFACPRRLLKQTVEVLLMFILLFPCWPVQATSVPTPCGQRAPPTRLSPPVHKPRADSLVMPQQFWSPLPQRSTAQVFQQGMVPCLLAAFAFGPGCCGKSPNPASARGFQ